MKHFKEFMNESKQRKMTRSLLGSIIMGIDDITNHGNNQFTVKRGFYDKKGKPVSVFEKEIVAKLEKNGYQVEILDSGEVEKPYKQGEPVKNQSHWWVKLKIRNSVNEAKDTSVLDTRNQIIKLDDLVLKMVKEWEARFPKGAGDKEAKIISDFLRDKKTFSLGKMSDTIGGPTISDGMLKYIVDKVKVEINAAGFSKMGSSMKTQSQAERADRFLSQKHIGLIKRK